MHAAIDCSGSGHKRKEGCRNCGSASHQSPRLVRTRHGAREHIYFSGYHVRSTRVNIMTVWYRRCHNRRNVVLLNFALVSLEMRFKSSTFADVRLMTVCTGNSMYNYQVIFFRKLGFHTSKRLLRFAHVRRAQEKEMAADFMSRWLSTVMRIAIEQIGQAMFW